MKFLKKMTKAYDVSPILNRLIEENLTPSEYEKKYNLPEHSLVKYFNNDSAIPVCPVEDDPCTPVDESLSSKIDVYENAGSPHPSSTHSSLPHNTTSLSYNPGDGQYPIRHTYLPDSSPLIDHFNLSPIPDSPDPTQSPLAANYSHNRRFQYYHTQIAPATHNPPPTDQEVAPYYEPIRAGFHPRIPYTATYPHPQMGFPQQVFSYSPLHPAAPYAPNFVYAQPVNVPTYISNIPNVQPYVRNY